MDWVYAPEAKSKVSQGSWSLGLPLPWGGPGTSLCRPPGLGSGTSQMDKQPAGPLSSFCGLF